MSKLIALFFISTALFGQATSNIIVIPTPADVVGSIDFREKRANGTNKVSVIAPDSIASDYTFLLRPYVDTDNPQTPINGDKRWFGTQTWKNTVYLENPALGGLNVLTADVNGFYWSRGSAGPGPMGNPIRVRMWQFTGLFNEGGSISVHTGNAGAETTVASMSLDGIDTAVAYSLNGSTLVNNAGQGFLNGLTLNVGTPVVGDCWRASSTGGLGAWSGCPGAITDYVTGSTTQTGGLGGGKIWTGAHTFRNASFLISESVAGNSFVDVQPDSSAFFIRRPSSTGVGNAIRVSLGPLSGITDSGRVETYNGTAGSEVLVNAMNASGVSSNVGFTVFDSSGNSRSEFIPSGATWRTPGGNIPFFFAMAIGGSPADYYGYMGLDSGGVFGNHTTTIDPVNGISTRAFKISTTTVIDSSRNATFASMASSGAVSGTSGTFTSMTINTGAATVGHCWTATSTGGLGAWSTCPSVITDYVTGATTQTTGLSGGKIWTGAHTFRNASFLISESVAGNSFVDVQPNSQSFFIRRPSTSGVGNQIRVSLGSLSGFTDSGRVETYSGTNTLVNWMNAGGVGTTVGFDANGDMGQTTTITVRNSAGTGTCNIAFKFGIKIVTGSTC